MKYKSIFEIFTIAILLFQIPLFRSQKYLLWAPKSLILDTKQQLIFHIADIAPNITIHIQIFGYFAHENILLFSKEILTESYNAVYPVEIIINSDVLVRYEKSPKTTPLKTRSRSHIETNVINKHFDKTPYPHYSSEDGTRDLKWGTRKMLTTTAIIKLFCDNIKYKFIEEIYIPIRPKPITFNVTFDKSQAIYYPNDAVMFVVIPINTEDHYIALDYPILIHVKDPTDKVIHTVQHYTTHYNSSSSLVTVNYNLPANCEYGVWHVEAWTGPNFLSASPRFSFLVVPYNTLKTKQSTSVDTIFDIRLNLTKRQSLSIHDTLTLEINAYYTMTLKNVKIIDNTVNPKQCLSGYPFHADVVMSVGVVHVNNATLVEINHERSFKMDCSKITVNLRAEDFLGNLQYREMSKTFLSNIVTFVKFVITEFQSGYQIVRVYKNVVQFNPVVVNNNINSDSHHHIIFDKDMQAFYIPGIPYIVKGRITIGNSPLPNAEINVNALAISEKYAMFSRKKETITDIQGYFNVRIPMGQQNTLDQYMDHTITITVKIKKINLARSRIIKPIPSNFIRIQRPTMDTIPKINTVHSIHVVYNINDNFTINSPTLYYAILVNGMIKYHKEIGINEALFTDQWSLNNPNVPYHKTLIKRTQIDIPILPNMYPKFRIIIYGFHTRNDLDTMVYDWLDIETKWDDFSCEKIKAVIVKKPQVNTSFELEFTGYPYSAVVWMAKNRFDSLRHLAYSEVDLIIENNGWTQHHFVNNDNYNNLTSFLNETDLILRSNLPNYEGTPNTMGKPCPDLYIDDWRNVRTQNSNPYFGSINLNDGGHNYVKIPILDRNSVWDITVKSFSTYRPTCINSEQIRLTYKHTYQAFITFQLPFGDVFVGQRILLTVMVHNFRSNELNFTIALNRKDARICTKYDAKNSAHKTSQVSSDASFTTQNGQIPAYTVRPYHFPLIPMMYGAYPISIELHEHDRNENHVRIDKLVKWLHVSKNHDGTPQRNLVFESISGRTHKRSAFGQEYPNLLNTSLLLTKLKTLKPLVGTLDSPKSAISAALYIYIQKYMQVLLGNFDEINVNGIQSHLISLNEPWLIRAICLAMHNQYLIIPQTNVCQKFLEWALTLKADGSVPMTNEFSNLDATAKVIIAKHECVKCTYRVDKLNRAHIKMLAYIKKSNLSNTESSPMTLHVVYALLLNNESFSTASLSYTQKSIDTIDMDDLSYGLLIMMHQNLYDNAWDWYKRLTFVINKALLATNETTYDNNHTLAEKIMNGLYALSRFISSTGRNSSITLLNSELQVFRNNLSNFLVKPKEIARNPKFSLEEDSKGSNFATYKYYPIFKDTCHFNATIVLEDLPNLSSLGPYTITSTPSTLTHHLSRKIMRINLTINYLNEYQPSDQIIITVGLFVGMSPISHFLPKPSNASPIQHIFTTQNSVVIFLRKLKTNQPFSVSFLIHRIAIVKAIQPAIIQIRTHGMFVQNNCEFFYTPRQETFLDTYCTFKQGYLINSLQLDGENCICFEVGCPEFFHPTHHINAGDVRKKMWYKACRSNFVWKIKIINVVEETTRVRKIYAIIENRFASVGITKPVNNKVTFLHKANCPNIFEISAVYLVIGTRPIYTNSEPQWIFDENYYVERWSDNLTTSQSLDTKFAQKRLNIFIQAMTNRTLNCVL